jgi:hypothetical protein
VNAIVISANNVSLDLGGFTIDGTDTVGSTGIVATSTLSVRIENGTVHDFHVGVNTNPVEGARIDGIDAVSNIRGFEVGSRTVVSDCQATANTENGIAILGQSSVVRDCLVLANTLDGIAVLGSGNIVERTKVASSTQGSDIRAGASAPGTHLRDNDVGDIRLESGSNVVVDNVCDAASPDIVDASVFIDFIAVAASPHENFECSVVQE